MLLGSVTVEWLEKRLEDMKYARGISLPQPRNEPLGWVVGYSAGICSNFEPPTWKTEFHFPLWLFGCWLLQKWNHVFAWIISLILRVFYWTRMRGSVFISFLLFASQTCTNFSSDQVERMTLVRKLPAPFWPISKGISKLRDMKREPRSQWPSIRLLSRFSSRKALVCSRTETR